MEFLKEYKDVILIYLDSILRIGSSFVISLSVVYLLGRMLGFLKDMYQKNWTAFITMVTCNSLYSYFALSFNTTFDRIWDIVLFTSLTIIMYVLVGFKLYDRVDDLLDKKIGDDSHHKGKK